MAFIRTIHGVFGEMILPLLTIVAAIYLTVTYKPDAPRGFVARAFPPLVGIQVLLGIILWVFLLFSTSGATQARYYSFPFILHPVIGILAAGFVEMAMGRRNLFGRLGRWASLATLGVVLLLILANVFIAMQA
jgi:hypothetical protein